MSNQPPRNYRDLGYSVTTRILSWEQAVRDAEGTRWNLPIGKYFFGDADQYVFVEYDDSISGPTNGTQPLPPFLYLVQASSTPNVLLDWNAAKPQTTPTGNSSYITNYNVYKSNTTQSNFIKIATVANSVLSYTDSHVDNGNTYYYYIVATDNLNNITLPSNTGDVTIPLPPPLILYANGVNNLNVGGCSNFVGFSTNSADLGGYLNLQGHGAISGTVVIDTLPVIAFGQAYLGSFHTPEFFIQLQGAVGTEKFNVVFTDSDSIVKTFSTSIASFDGKSFTWDGTSNTANMAHISNTAIISVNIS